MNKNGLLTFISIVAVFALLLGWLAFNRSGKNVVPTVRDESIETAQEIEEEAKELEEEAGMAAMEAQEEISYMATRAEIEARLIAIQADYLANEVTDETLMEIADLRRDIKINYEEAEEEVQAEIDQVDAELERLEQEARNDTSQSLLILEGLIEIVRKDIATDTPQE